jgi:hypothetical protein
MHDPPENFRLQFKRQQARGLLFSFYQGFNGIIASFAPGFDDNTIAPLTKKCFDSISFDPGMFLSGRKEITQKTPLATLMRTATLVMAVRIRGLIGVIWVRLRR